MPAALIGIGLRGIGLRGIGLKYRSPYKIEFPHNNQVLITDIHISIILSNIIMANVLTIKATFPGDQERSSEIHDPDSPRLKNNLRHDLDWKPLTVSSSSFIIECNMDGMNNYINLPLSFDPTLIKKNTKRFDIKSNGLTLTMTVARKPNDKYHLSKFSVKCQELQMVKNFYNTMIKYHQASQRLVIDKNRLTQLEKEIEELKARITPDQELYNKITPTLEESYRKKDI